MYLPPQHKKLTVVVLLAQAAQHVRTELVAAELFGTRTTHTADTQVMAIATTQVAAHMVPINGTMAEGVARAATTAGEASGLKSKSASITNEGNR